MFESSNFNMGSYGEFSNSDIKEDCQLWWVPQDSVLEPLLITSQSMTSTAALNLRSLYYLLMTQAKYGKHEQMMWLANINEQWKTRDLHTHF